MRNQKLIFKQGRKDEEVFQPEDTTDINLVVPERYIHQDHRMYKLYEKLVSALNSKTQDISEKIKNPNLFPEIRPNEICALARKELRSVLREMAEDPNFFSDEEWRELKNYLNETLYQGKFEYVATKNTLYQDCLTLKPTEKWDIEGCAPKAVNAMMGCNLFKSIWDFI